MPIPRNNEGPKTIPHLGSAEELREVAKNFEDSEIKLILRNIADIIEAVREKAKTLQEQGDTHHIQTIEDNLVGIQHKKQSADATVWPSQAPYERGKAAGISITLKDKGERIHSYLHLYTDKPAQFGIQVEGKTIKGKNIYNFAEHLTVAETSSPNSSFRKEPYREPDKDPRNTIRPTRKTEKRCLTIMGKAEAKTPLKILEAMHTQLREIVLANGIELPNFNMETTLEVIKKAAEENPQLAEALTSTLEKLHHSTDVGRKIPEPIPDMLDLDVVKWIARNESKEISIKQSMTDFSISIETTRKLILEKIHNWKRLVIYNDGQILLIEMDKRGNQLQQINIQQESQQIAKEELDAILTFLKEAVNPY